MIAALRRRIARVRDESGQDRGISLVELIIAMMIFALLLAMTVGFFTSAGKASSVDRNIDSTTRQASNGLNEMTRVIRGATTNSVLNQQLPDPAFVTAGDNTITLYSQVNLSSNVAQPILVNFSLNSSNYLVEKIWQPVSSGGYFTFNSSATPSTTRILAGPVVLPAAGGPNLFSYIDTNNAAIATTNTTVANVSAIAGVTVSLQVGTANTTSQSTLLTDTVGLPNLNIARTYTP